MAGTDLFHQSNSLKCAVSHAVQHDCSYRDKHVPVQKLIVIARRCFTD